MNGPDKTYCLKPGFMLSGPKRKGTADSEFDNLNQSNTANMSHGGDLGRNNPNVFKPNKTFGENAMR